MTSMIDHKDGIEPYILTSYYMNGIETNYMEETWTLDNPNEAHHVHEIGFTSLIEHADEV